MPRELTLQGKYATFDNNKSSSALRITIGGYMKNETTNQLTSKVNKKYLAALLLSLALVFGALPGLAFAETSALAQQQALPPGWCGPDCELCGLDYQPGQQPDPPPTTNQPTAPTDPQPPVDCITCDDYPCICCPTCSDYPCSCATVAAQQTLPPAAAAAATPDPNAGPRTGDEVSWFVPMAIISLLVAVIAAVGLAQIRKRKLCSKKTYQLNHS